MFQPPPECEIVLRTPDRNECRESGLVLDATGIAFRSTHHKGWWYLIVNQSDFETAAAELEAYRHENSERSSGVSEPSPIYEGAVAAIFVYAGVILVTALLDLRWDLVEEGRMQAGRVTDGELWRTVTALTLHVDVLHLLSNLVFGAVFGLLAGKVLGGGVAWLAIVIAGGLGNLLNALAREAEHTSIGASTAVFAALGVVVANALRPAAFSQGKAMKRWSPLIGGVVLFALTGVGGERTDVLAHGTGFLAGMLIGWAGRGIPSQWLAKLTVQMCTGALTLTIVLAAWIMAIAFRGQ